MSLKQSFACGIAQTRSSLRWAWRFHPLTTALVVFLTVVSAGALLKQGASEYYRLRQALSKRTELAQAIETLTKREARTESGAAPGTVASDIAAASLNDFLATLAKQREETSITLSEVDLQSSRLANAISSHEVRMRASGPFMNIYAWLSEMLVRHPTLALQSIEVRRDTPAAPVVDVQLVLVLFTE